MKKWIDRGVSLYEYFIVFLFLRGAYNVYDAKSPTPVMKVLNPLVGHTAIVIYAAVFAVLGLSLLGAKLFKRKRIHGYTLQAMYLVAFYIVSLSILVNGWQPGIVLSIFYTLSMAGLYLYWRFKVMGRELEKRNEEV